MADTDAPGDTPQRQIVRRRVRVRGIVQGVGFRPTVYRLAAERGLAGWVLNDAEGVLMEIEGPPAAIDSFLDDLRAHPPPLAVITAVESAGVPATGEKGFRIAPSAAGHRSALVSPDMATCPDCLRELADPADRRYRYPFINCTNCGPRYSIILDVPYDRPNTTMRSFTMCRACQAEYDSPADRRFHAQPNACPACGPRLALYDGAGRPLACDDPIQAARRMLLAGGILAIKGLTGFHLAADARNDETIRELRRRKGRDQKAFAMMAGSADHVRRCTLLDEAERALLESVQRPIVLLRKRPGHDLSALVAPRSPYFGFMLPYAPVHHLLFQEDLPPMVMTSGNLSEEPICRENDEALERLAGIADAYLMHDRPIHTVCDDSVMVVQRGRPLMLRRGRGFAPRPVAMPIEAAEPVLAVGPELKNCVALVRGREVFLSQHIGDLKNALANGYFEATVEKLERLLEIAPRLVAHDMHPGYLSTRYARRRAARDERVRLVAVQHHHAHVASVMAEHGLEGEVIGLAMDGTGYGPDGTVWGGEILRASASDCQRLGHLRYVALAGADAAIEHPVRTAWAMLVEAFGRTGARRHRVGYLASVAAKDLELWADMIEAGFNAPRACGLGRLFDAVSTLAGVCAESTYEGQPAVELEAVAGTVADDAPPYQFAIEDAPAAGPDGPQGWVIDTRPLVRDVVADVETGQPADLVSARFHSTVAAMLRAAAHRARLQTGLGRVVLSGGCFANDRLVRLLAPALESEGFQVYVHSQVPPGDGGVALGQAYVAAARLLRGT